MQHKFQWHRWLHKAAGLAWLMGSALPVLAQAPALDTDGWVRFPPRPRSAPMPIEVAPPPMPEPTPAANQRVKPKGKPTPAAATEAAPPPPARIEPERTASQDTWIRFPVLPSRPSAAVAVPAPAAQDTPPPTTTARVAPTATAVPSTNEANPLAVAAPKQRRIVDFTVTGNERVSSEEIMALITPQRGQSLNADTLRQVTDAVSDLYQRKGILALVEMPAQDLTSGVPLIKISEAQFAGVVVEDPKGELKRNPHLPVAIVERLQPKGERISLPELDEAGALLKEIPGVDIQLSLRPGEQAGQTQAVALVEPSKPIEAQVGIDDAGAKATGELRQNARLTLNNPLKIGDSATVQLLHSKGMDYQRASYSVPVGNAGWRVGVNTSNSRYQVVSSEFEYLNARGPAHTTGVDLTVPLLRGAQDSVTLQLAADQRKYRNEALDTVQSEYKGSTVSAYLEGSHRDGVQSETTASLQVVGGKIDLSGSTLAHQVGDAATAQTAGDYTKARLAFMHRQELNPSNTLMLSAQSQWANKNLDSSEKFFLGGANGVRAYPTNEAGGSLGQLLSMEWQRHFTWDQRRVTAAGFYDKGRIQINKYNHYAQAPEVNRYGLSGAGFWIGTSIPNRYGLTTMRFTAAHRLGTNEGASLTTDLDQDGTRVLNRYRFSLTQTF